MSSKYIYAQAVHLPSAQTLAQASSFEKTLKESLLKTSDCTAAAHVGRTIAERLVSQDIRAIVHEMPEGKKYHGKLKALLDGLQEGGVKLL